MSEKWQQSLLKSSLPLESIIAKIVHELGFGVFGEYTYLRHDRNGNNAEFSVDIYASRLMSKKKDYWASIELLIECKYSDPNTKWLFSKIPKDEVGISLPARILDDLTTRRFPDFRDRCHRKFAAVEYFLNDVPYCFKGVKLHSSGCDTEVIERGFSQLIYAMPNLIRDCLIPQAREWNDEDLHICIICPILVTTSPLLILNDNIEFEKVQKAKDISEIATEKSVVLLHRRAGADLGKYARNLYHEIVSDIDVKIRLAELNSLHKEPFEDYLGADFNMRINYLDSLNTIIVVNYSAFEELIRLLTKTVHSSYSKLIRVGYLHKDIKERKRWLSSEPISANK